MLLPYLFNFYAECIIQIAGLDEAQAQIKTAGRNINDLRYAYDTTLTVESEEELKILLMKVKEEREKEIRMPQKCTQWQSSGKRRRGRNQLVMKPVSTPRRLI